MISESPIANDSAASAGASLRAEPAGSFIPDPSAPSGSDTFPQNAPAVSARHSGEDLAVPPTSRLGSDGRENHGAEPSELLTVPTITAEASSRVTAPGVSAEMDSPAATQHAGESSIETNPDRVAERNRRENILREFRSLLDLGWSRENAARQVGVAYVTLWRWSQADGTRDKRDNCGRSPAYLPTGGELAVVRAIYTRLDESTARGRGLGSSKVTAFRLAAKSTDPETSDKISNAFRDVVLKRKNKNIPPSWARLLDLPASVLDAARDQRSTMSAYISTPRGRTFVDDLGVERPLTTGVIFEADDGTLNFYAWIPWPYGGDPCSEKFGVKLGRWQLLAVVDLASEHCPAFDIVCRERSSYRAEDSGCLLGRTMAEIGIPSLWRLERGSWESKFVRELLQLVGVPCKNAWHSKQKSAIERFFDRLWTPASLIPGHVGRDRARFKQTEDMAQACQAGRRDPRDFFLSLEAATPKLINAVQFVNSEPIKSNSGWGTWVPIDRFREQTASSQILRKMEPSQRIFFSREQKVWTVRGCCVGGAVAGPLINFPVYFQHESLWEFEGCRVRVYFDPYADDVRATIVLADDAWRSYKRGHIIAADVPSLELPPQAVLAADWSNEDTDSLKRRKAAAKAVRTEMWNWLGTRRTEARDGAGNQAVREESRTGVAPVSSRPQLSAPNPQPAPRLPAGPDADEVRRRRERLAREAEMTRQLTGDFQ